MSQTDNKHSVSILWGQVPEDDDKPKTYTFDTQAELDAFMLGVKEMDGWMGWRVIDPGYRWCPEERDVVPIEDEAE